MYNYKRNYFNKLKLIEKNKIIIKKFSKDKKWKNRSLNKSILKLKNNKSEINFSKFKFNISKYKFYDKQLLDFIKNKYQKLNNERSYIEAINFTLKKNYNNLNKFYKNFKNIYKFINFKKHEFKDFKKIIYNQKTKFSFINNLTYDSYIKNETLNNQLFLNNNNTKIILLEINNFLIKNELGKYVLRNYLKKLLLTNYSNIIIGIYSNLSLKKIKIILSFFDFEYEFKIILDKNFLINNYNIKFKSLSKLDLKNSLKEKIILVDTKFIFDNTIKNYLILPNAYVMKQINDNTLYILCQFLLFIDNLSIVDVKNILLENNQKLWKLNFN